MHINSPAYATINGVLIPERVTEYYPPSDENHSWCIIFADGRRIYASGQISIEVEPEVKDATDQ